MNNFQRSNKTITNLIATWFNTDRMIQKANVTIHIVNRSLVTSLVVTSFNDSLALVTAAQLDIVLYL